MGPLFGPNPFPGLVGQEAEGHQNSARGGVDSRGEGLDRLLENASFREELTILVKKHVASLD